MRGRGTEVKGIRVCKRNSEKSIRNSNNLKIKHISLLASLSLASILSFPKEILLIKLTEKFLWLMGEEKAKT